MCGVGFFGRAGWVLGCILLLGAPASAGGYWLCEPEWDLFPGAARHDSWPLSAGQGAGERFFLRPGVEGERWPVSWRGEEQWQHFAVFDVRSGLLASGWGTDWSGERVGSKYLAPGDRAHLAALRAEMPVSPEVMTALPHAWWKTFNRCRPVSAWAFWPQFFLRQLGAVFGAMG